MSEDQQLPPAPPAGSPAVPPPPPSSPSPPAAGESPNRTIMIVLSYLWLLALIPFLVEKNDKEVQWHAKHGLVLTAAEVILWMALWVVSIVVGMVWQPLSCVISLVMLLIWIGLVVFHVLCMVKGVNGERLLVPGVSEYAERF